MPENDSLLDLTHQSNDINDSKIEPAGNQRPIESNHSTQPIQPISIVDSINPAVQTDQSSNLQMEVSKKSKKWIWILIIIVLTILGLGGGGYWYYSTQIKSGESDLDKYHKGPSLGLVEKNITGPIGFYSTKNALIYQKNEKDAIYGNFYDTEINGFKILDTFGASLVNISPDAKYCIIYFKDNPSVLKDDNEEIKKIKNQLQKAKGNYYLANLEDNKIINLGSNLSSFMWLTNNLVFLRNSTELLTYDFRLANYSAPIYQGPIDIYYKIIDITYPIVSLTGKPNSNLIYTIQENPTDKKTSVYTYDLSTKKFTKIMETNAISISISPTGKYYLLLNYNKNKISIYTTEDNKLYSEIENALPNPIVYTWMIDQETDQESAMYYFSKKDLFSSNLLGKNKPASADFATIKYFYDLIKYDLKSKNTSIILSGNKYNIADPTNLTIDAIQKKIFFTTEQNNNIYQTELK
jgi:hypothetical protein